MNEKIPNRSTFFIRPDQYDASSCRKKRHHHHKCKVRGCEAPSFLDGLCPFHYDLVSKKEIRQLLKYSTYLLNTISHQLPLATFQIISPAEIPKNCEFFNKYPEYPDYPVPLDDNPPEEDNTSTVPPNNIDETDDDNVDDFFTNHDSIFSQFEKEQFFNPIINHSFCNNMCFPTIIPPCQNYLRYNKAPICIGERCQFYKLQNEDINE